MTHPLTGDTIRKVIFGDNLDVLATMPDESVDLIYIDPAFQHRALSDSEVNPHDPRRERWRPCRLSRQPLPDR